MSYVIIKSLAQTKFANLINIINDQENIPELIQSKCTVDNIGKIFNSIVIKANMYSQQAPLNPQTIKVPCAERIMYETALQLGRLAAGHEMLNQNHVLLNYMQIKMIIF